jgi:hypothetical protein
MSRIVLRYNLKILPFAFPKRQGEGVGGIIKKMQHATITDKEVCRLLIEKNRLNGGAI